MDQRSGLPAGGLAHVITDMVPALPAPQADLFTAALAAETTREAHDRLALDLPAFNALELRTSPPRDIPAGPLVIAAWNAERLKHAGSSADLVRASGADVLLLTEADVGMARSGNRHTVAELADALGMGYAYGVEFVELGLGDARERQWHRGERNRVGFHGNAILSRLALSKPSLIRLDDGAVWWIAAKDDQRRLGYRMAVAAEIETRAGPILAVSVHLESKSDAADRAAQISRLIDTLERLYPGLPAVIGGDLNTKALPLDPATWLAGPDAQEPLFALMRAAGFDWRDANTAEPTIRTLPDGEPQPPFRRIDWLFARGLEVASPRTVEAVDAAGSAISDHEMIAIDVTRR